MSIQPAGERCSSLVAEPLSVAQAEPLARVFKAIGDPVRLRLLSLIASHVNAQACVCDILPAFELSQPTISHHLKVLRDAGVLESERRGTWVYYRVIPAALQQLSSILMVDPASRISGSDCREQM
ncbi:ArsR/SmtB family transcription factor [Gordonia sp. CPCC 205333]|uniref:ArsR/SmtB family transcription factor n=1 Tax=Gordonia sp. CPCC 205333 TaxID=3140790 RepID=UPI003AF3FD88